jgi:hypothetical protein
MLYILMISACGAVMIFWATGLGGHVGALGGLFM